jgi:hypothetical protein
LVLQALLAIQAAGTEELVGQQVLERTVLVMEEVAVRGPLVQGMGETAVLQVVEI